MRFILTDQIGRHPIFFEPDNGANGGTNGTVVEGAPGTGNQSGPQQQPTEFQSPFTGIDRNLLDDATRNALDKAESDMKNLHGRAAQASKYQSELDQTKAQYEQTKTHLQQLQSGLQQQQQQRGQSQQQQSLTVEQEFEKILVDEGMAPDVAKRTATIQAKLQGVYGKLIEDRIGTRFAPLAANVIDSNTSDAFEMVKQNDPLGIFQQEEVSQRVWDQISDIAKNGTLVTPEIVQNLGRIYYIEHLEKNGGHPNQQVNNPPPVQQQQQQTTRFTYPGAGNVPRLPQAQPEGGNMDSETFAALAATTSGWSVQPKQFKGAGVNGKVHITRGGI